MMVMGLWIFTTREVMARMNCGGIWAMEYTSWQQKKLACKALPIIGN